MHARGINKYFLCRSCGLTFNQNVDPNYSFQAYCPCCNQSSTEVLDTCNDFPEQTSIPDSYGFTSNITGSFGSGVPEALSYGNPFQIPDIGGFDDDDDDLRNNWQVTEIIPTSHGRGNRRSHNGFIGSTSQLFDVFNINMFDEIGSLFSPSVDINLEDFGINIESNYDPEYALHLAERISMEEAQRTKKPPVSKKVVSKLPIFKIEQKHCKKGADGKSEPPVCAICCSNIALGEQCQLIPCGHMYHPKCIKPWFDENNTCPTCRYELPTDDESYEKIRKQSQGPRRSVIRPERRNPPQNPLRKVTTKIKPPVKAKPQIVKAKPQIAKANLQILKTKPQIPKTKPQILKTNLQFLKTNPLSQ